MNRALTMLLLPLVMIALPGCQSDDLRGDLEGVIIDHVTEEPLEGVLVSCRSLKNDRVATDETDADGAYRVENATYGLNEVTLTLDGYYEKEAYADIEKDHAISADFDMVRILDRNDLNFSVDVVDDRGNPRENASVAVYQRFKDEYGGLGYGDSLLATSRTDARGRAYFLGVTTLVEQEIIFIRTDAAALGYQTASAVTTVVYPTTNLALRLRLEPLP